MELAWLRCHIIGYIFQSFTLSSVATALDNVMLPMTFAGMPQDKAQDKATGRLGGYNRSWQTFMLGMAGDAMGRYCEAFPQQKEYRAKLVRAYREWMSFAKGLDAQQRRRAVNLCVANGFAYAARFSGDESLLTFAAENCISDKHFSPHYRTGTTSAKHWSEYGHRLVQVFLHDIDKKRHPERYGGLP